MKFFFIWPNTQRVLLEGSESLVETYLLIDISFMSHFDIRCKPTREFNILILNPNLRIGKTVS